MKVFFTILITLRTIAKGLRDWVAHHAFKCNLHILAKLLGLVHHLESSLPRVL